MMLGLCNSIIAQKNRLDKSLYQGGEKVVIKNNRKLSIYENDQLIYVSKDNTSKKTYQFNPNSIIEIENGIENIALFNKQRSNNLKLNIKNLHKESYIIFAYFLMLFILTVFFDDFKNLLVSFKINNQVSNGLIITLLIFSSALVSLLFEFTSFISVFSFFIFYLLLSFVFAQFVENYSTKTGFLKSKFLLLFKLLNLIFCLFIAYKLYYYGNVKFPINEPTLITSVVILSAIYSMIVLIKQHKINSLSYIFYYICAFEILPAFILKVFLF